MTSFEIKFDAIIFYFWLPEDELTTIFSGKNKWWFMQGMGYKKCVFYGPNIRIFKHFIQGPIEFYAVPSSHIKFSLLRGFLFDNHISRNPILSIVVEGGIVPEQNELIGALIPIQCIIADTHHTSNPLSFAVSYVSEVAASMVFVSHSQHRKIFSDCLGIAVYPLVWTAKEMSSTALNLVSAKGSRASYYGIIEDLFHPERTHILKKIKGSEKGDTYLNFKHKLNPNKWLESVSEDIALFTCSLNGSPSVQSYAPLLCETCLITDLLTEKSDLGSHLINGVNCLIYKNEAEAIQALEFVINKPDEVREIGRAGTKLLNKIVPEFGCNLHNYCLNTNYLASVLAEKPYVHCLININLDAYLACCVYQLMQELHRLSASLFVAIRGNTKISNHIRDYAKILPRLLVLESSSFDLLMPLPNNAECAVWIGNNKSYSLDEGIIGEYLTLKIADPINQNFHKLKISGIWINPGSILQCDFDGHKFPQFIPSNIIMIHKNSGALGSRRSLLKFVSHAKNLGSNEVRPWLQKCIDVCTNEVQALNAADACGFLDLTDLRYTALQRALHLNRDCYTALIQLADLAFIDESHIDAAILLSEASRVEQLPAEFSGILAGLILKVSNEPKFLEYKLAIAGGDHPIHGVSRRILVVTNLFPPQELGGYGRKIWEFSAALVDRGHEVLILTSDSPYLLKAADDSEMVLESKVCRILNLTGEWKDGKTTTVGTSAEQYNKIQTNAAIVSKKVNEFIPDFVLLGNLDFLGVDLVLKLIDMRIPVIHSLGNQTPGYAQKDCFKSPLYVLAPASNWLGSNLLRNGYSAPRMETVYPGARIDRFYRHILPDCRRLRIAYAGLQMPYKGPDLLIIALVLLNNAGIDFEAEIAGDTTDPMFVSTLTKFVADNGLSAKVKFIGYQGRKALASLFARSNVLVFPSQVDEAFGISQVEAMASGLIVVTSGRGGAREVVQHGINGLIFEAGNASSLAQNLHFLHLMLSKEEIWVSLQSNARARAIELSVIASVKRLENIAESMIAGCRS